MIHISPVKKSNLYEQARRNLIEWYGEDKVEAGSCLFWAQVAMRTLERAGLRRVLQAGDLQWQMVPRELDDGVSPTHFSYIWSETRSTVIPPEGHLPEIHVWVGLPDSGEIVDFSTGTFKKLAIERHGLRWLGPDPPKFLWGVPPDGTIYRPYREATLFAFELLKAY